jgi:O-acetyl-ADP-ribose deacetylase (regulator of RNase III)
MIVYKSGNIFDFNERYIAHGVNCCGGFGSGIAREIAVKFPEAKEAYLYRYNTQGWKLGDVAPVPFDSGTGFIINCATQENYGPVDKGPYVSYPAIRLVIRELVRLYPQGFAIPKMGAGLAGGNWEIIAKIIEEETLNTEVRVYVK